VDVTFTECEMKARDSCYSQTVYEPQQEKIHQEKCIGGGLISFEGDMMLSKEQLEWFKTGLLEGELDGEKREEKKKGEKKERKSSLTNPNRLWPDNVVYYSFDLTVNSSRKNEVRSILSDLQEELSLCLTFEERNEGNRIIVGSSRAGCWSEVGYKRKGPQKLNLENENEFCWFPDIIEHEFLHAIGIFHTQSRSDRDDYVNVEEDNIQEGKDRNFNKYDQIRMPHHDLVYDYSSLMHYPPDAFGIQDAFGGQYPRITIDPKEPSKLYIIGQQPSVSSGDVQQVQRLYQCHSAGSRERRSPDQSTGKSASSTFQPIVKSPNSPRPISQSTGQDEEIPVLDFFTGSRFGPGRGRGR